MGLAIPKAFTIVLTLFHFGISFLIFNKIYSTSKSVIDEEFHLRQGLHYCNGEFSEWDSKITTLPGLYIVSCIVILFNGCNTYGLRLVSLVSSFLNVYLIYKIRKRKEPSLRGNKLIIESISIASLPPLYFFGHLYYTDVVSITFILAMYNFWDREHHNMAALFGGLSVLMRQTNIVWVVLFLGTSFLNELIDLYSYRKNKKRKSISLFNPSTVCDILRSWGIVLQSIVNTLRTFYGYILIVTAFLSFVIINGSIVIGDKNAHEATLHIPQLFYFATFTLMFTAPFSLKKINSLIAIAKKSWKSYATCTLICMIVSYFNTLVHPYLLADNRHYTFYIWHRFYGQYWWFKYAIAPLYIMSLNIIQLFVAHLSTSFQVMFWIASFTALCSQRLLEVRYFLIPFLLVRLNIRNNNMKVVAFELVSNIIVNALTILIFIRKEIKWSNYTEPQRIIW